MIDFLILYEHKLRELDNACLLKYLLTRKGYRVKIACAYNTELPGVVQPFYFQRVRTVLVPWLYGDGEVKKLSRLFRDAQVKVVNLQYEQILAHKWIAAGYHFPKGLAKDAYHVCWGDVTARRLRELGIPQENLLQVGSMALDYDRPELRGLYLSRQTLAQAHGLDENRKWLLFISSFSLNNMTEAELDELRERTQVDNRPFMRVMMRSKETICRWLLEFADTHPDYEVIYRAHPGERQDPMLLQQEKAHKNFHVINAYSVGQWIFACDYINNWISTSVADAVCLGKAAALLRPEPVAHDDDSELFDGAVPLTNYRDFAAFNEGHSGAGNLDLRRFYDLPDTMATQRLVEALEACSAKPGHTYHLKNTEGIRWLRSLLAYSCYASGLAARLTGNATLRQIRKETNGLRREIREKERRIRETLGDS